MAEQTASAAQAVAAAQAQISGDNPATTDADNPDQGHATGTNGTSQANGQPAEQTGHVDDVLNPKNLPPELRPHLDNMVKAYRDKTEKLSETVKSEVAKAVEAHRQKAEQYDLLVADPDVVKAVNDLLERRKAPDPNQDPVKRLEEKVKTFEERTRYQEQVKEYEQEVVKFESAVDEKTGKPLHPNFVKFSEMLIGEASGRDGKKEPVSVLKVAIMTAPGETPQEKLANGYAAVQKWHDSIFEEGKKEGMGRLKQKAAGASIPPSGSFAPSGIAPERAKSGLDAIRFARQGLSPAQ